MKNPRAKSRRTLCNLQVWINWQACRDVDARGRLSTARAKEKSVEFAEVCCVEWFLLAPRQVGESR